MLKKTLITLGISALSLQNYAQVDSSVLFQNHEYRFIQQEGIDGKDAKAAVPAGWYLASITSAEEQAFVEVELAKLPDLPFKHAHYFIGASGVMTGTEWTWTWDCGDAWNYTNWVPEEPTPLKNQSCVAIRKDIDYKWNNLYSTGESTYTAGYILERPATSKIVRFQNSEYTIIQSNGITIEQIAAAVPEGWHLATVTSAEEQDFLAVELAQMSHVTNQPDHYFIGAECVDGEWRWSNGEVWNYSNWGPGEPSGTYETIGAIRESLGTDTLNNWKWNNISRGAGQSSYFAGYIIERNIPSTIVVYSKDEGDGLLSRTRMIVRNEGDAPVSDIKLYYYFTAEKSAEVLLEDWYSPSCTVSLLKISNGNYAIEYDYTGYTFEKGKDEYLGENIVGIKYADYSEYNRFDDYSFIQSSDFVKNTLVSVKKDGVTIYGQDPLFRLFPVVTAQSFDVYPNPASQSDILKVKYTLPAGVSDNNVTLVVYKDSNIQKIDISGKNDQEVLLPELNRWNCGAGNVYSVVLQVNGVNAKTSQIIFNY